MAAQLSCSVDEAGGGVEPGDELRGLPVHVPLPDVPQPVFVARPHFPRRPARLLAVVVPPVAAAAAEAGHAPSHCS